MDYAHQHRQRLIASAGGELSQSLEETLAASINAKCQRAITWLGSTWVHHPAYDAKLHPHHNPSCKSSVVLDKYRLDRAVML